MYPKEKQMADKGLGVRAEENMKDVKFANNVLASNADKSTSRKMMENLREVGTKNTAMINPDVKLLEKLANTGIPTEVSGDALARAKYGQTPKLHRS
jgi:hypothetical protein